MKENENDSKKASRLITAVLDGSLTAEDALASWPAMSESSSKVLKNAYHLMHHYFADSDIRARDEEYATYQRCALEKCVGTLSSEQPDRNRT
jgi:hypothetical protein